MSRVPTKSARRAARAVASSPAVAGFRPAGMALAVAVACGLPAGALAQPVVAPNGVVHGGAQFFYNGQNLLVITTNGARTNHSVINYSSFSVPGGSLTEIRQPSDLSTSIGRVTGATRSEIFGTLLSNGRLVLVNPSGIVFGPASQVDTAAFTASTLSLGQDDAIAGRMLFSGGDQALAVQGRIVGRSGDVVLIAPQVQVHAGTPQQPVLVQSQGATVLAAGQQVEITGRGLEGIRMQVQAPANQAVNLGHLQGDAVAIFAGTLKHSGQATAHALSTEGGKVVLKAAGDNLVSGTVTAQRADGRGGSIDVLGERVGLQAGALLQASGPNGGGQVRVGGGFQGRDAGVPNARTTTVDAQARIAADATAQGDGGRVIVWSDEHTRMAGQVSARGGAAGGNGGFAEVSGKKYLEYTGRADLRAPRGRFGTLLLDPEYLDIVDGAVGGSTTNTITDADLSSQLNDASVQLSTTTSTASSGGGMIKLHAGADVGWSTGTTLSLVAGGGVEIFGALNGANGHVDLQANDGYVFGNGSIRATSLFVRSQGSTGPSAGKVWLDGANQVGTLAGYTDGSAAEFHFHNATPLTIGPVTNAYSSYNGLYAANGTVDITAAGGLVVAPQTLVNGGTVKLEATGTGADVTIGRTTINAGSGALEIKAGRDILFATEPASSYSAGLYGGASLLLDAGRDVVIGEAAPTVSSSVYVESSGPLSILGARNVRIGGTDTVPQYTTVSSGSGSGGGVLIQATGGDVDLGLNTSVWAYGGGVTVQAQGSILGRADISAERGGIELTATDGAVRAGRLWTIGSSDAPTPQAINVRARQDIEIAGADAYAYGYSTSVGAGTGGSIQLVSEAGNILVHDTINADGPSLGGGTGGSILLQALGTGAGAGNVTVGFGLSAQGGSLDYFDLGQAGNGGTVTVKAHRDIRIGGGDVEYPGGGVRVGGGYSGYSGSVGPGAGGAGGTVVLASNTGSVLLPDAASSIDASGGGGRVGGRGGTVDIQAAVDVAIPNIRAQGGLSQTFAVEDGSGNPVPVAGERGGDGGSILVRFGNALATSGVDAKGGQGGDGTVSANGAAGGTGGSIKLERTAGDFRIDGAYRVDATGGQGGSAALGGGGLGGAGGQGGSIVLNATGKTTLASADIHAEGGAGGSNSDGSQAAAGGMGDFAPSGTEVEVEGSFELRSYWSNRSAIHLRGAAAVLGNGVFKNFSHVNLYDAASLSPTGGVLNLAGARMSAFGPSVSADLRSNSGLLEVAAGARLATPFFSFNDGTVQVDGTLDVGANCSTCPVRAVTPSSGPIFQNAAAGLLTGNGTLAVGGGTGTLDNAGTIAPGADGTVGTFTVDANLLMQSGSQLKTDIASSTAYDLLRVTGAAQSGGAIAVNYLPGAAFDAGTALRVLQSTALDATTLPTVNVPHFNLAANATDLLMVANTAFPVPPPPPPPPSQVNSQEILQINNQVVTFAQLFVQEALTQQQEEAEENRIGKDDIVITDTQCKP